jgi:hypothetical protein
VLAELARWGYQWTWSAPRSHERVDVGAIFRLAPGLIEPDGTNGEIELNVTDGHRDGGPLTYTVTIGAERVDVAQRAGEEPGARISGDSSAWIKAFAPEQDERSLLIDGDLSLAQTLIASLAQRSVQQAAAAGEARQVA